MRSSNACLKPSITGAQRADMGTSEERRASFHNVRKHHKVSVAELVESGFFKADIIPDCAEADAVVCYYCRVILDRWRESDSVQKEHLRETRTSRGGGCAYALYVRRKTAPKPRSVGFQRRFPQEKTKGFRSKSPKRSESGGEQEDAGARSSDAPTSMAVNPAASMPSGLGGPLPPVPPPPVSTPPVSTSPAAHVPAPPPPPPPRPLSHYASSTVGVHDMLSCCVAQRKSVGL